MSALEDLKIVLLDGLCLRGAALDRDQSTKKQAQHEIAKSCPKIQELDLSRNLIEDWDDVANICQPLKYLRVLKLRLVYLTSLDFGLTQNSGNRLQSLPFIRRFPEGTPFATVQEIYLDETLTTYEQVCYEPWCFYPNGPLLT